MPRLVVNPRTKYGFEATYNPALRMSNGAASSIKFKMDQERAKYEKTIKLLNWSEKVEMRITQKQVEEVKQELTLMRAYQHVAKQMAFKNFDPVIRRRRERREKQRQEEEDRLLEELDQKRRQKVDNGDENDDENNDGGGMINNSDVNNKRDSLIPEDNSSRRRLSMNNGNVFVTLQDIIGNDDVLRRNSQEIHQMRRKSQASLELDYDDESFGKGSPRRRKSGDASLWKIRSPRRRGSMASDASGDNKDTVKESGSSFDVDETDGDGGGGGVSGGFSSGNFLGVGRINNETRRRSRGGSFGAIELGSIEEHGAETVKDKDMNSRTHGKENDNVEIQMDSNASSSIENKPNNIVVSGRKGFKTTGNLVKGFFITSTAPDENEEKSGKGSKRPDGYDAINDNRERPMTIFQMSKFYQQQKSHHMEESKSKDINQQKKTEQRKYELIRRRLQNEKFDKVNKNRKKAPNITKVLSAPDQLRTNESTKPTQEIEITSEENISPPEEATPRSKTVPIIKEPSDESENQTTTIAPNVESLAKLGAPLKGMARFKNAATAVAVQLKISNPKKDKPNQLKNIAAAVMMRKSTTAGRVPKAFMYSDTFADRFSREKDKTKATALETSHRKQEDCKVRPLAMPESVKVEYAEKWKSLMGNINGAVHWKVRALREDTGTLSSRQMRRQLREDHANPTHPHHHHSISPRNPSRSVFPGACKTTWAVKKFVSREIDDVLKMWKPDNVRRKRNQNMKDKASFPDFIDRVRTTTSILRSFRSYCKEKGDKKEEEEEDNGDNDKDDDDDQDEDKEDENCHVDVINICSSIDEEDNDD